MSPLAFLRAVKAAGLKTFDAWAHHPYYAGPSDQPTTKPVTAKGAPATAVTLGNISDLIREVTRLYGNKRIWITEYGYQTNPPDKLYGVTYAKQAAYLTQAFAIARKNPRIDMMLWFLLKDDPNLNGWQSGSDHRTRREEARVRRVHEDGGGDCRSGALDRRHMEVGEERARALLAQRRHARVDRRGGDVQGVDERPRCPRDSGPLREQVQRSCDQHRER